MKNYGAGPWQFAAIFLVIAIIGAAATCRALDDCTDIDGFSIPCSRQQPTLLKAATSCTDLDGFTVPCGNRQITLVDYRDPCVDSLADRFAEGPPAIDYDKCPKENKAIVLSQGRIDCYACAER